MIVPIWQDRSFWLCRALQFEFVLVTTGWQEQRMIEKRNLREQFCQIQPDLYYSEGSSIRKPRVFIQNPAFIPSLLTFQ